MERSYSADLRPYGLSRPRLYHYSSCVAVASIIASDRLRATDAAHLEDHNELRVGIPVCVEALRALRDTRLDRYLTVLEEGLTNRFGHRVFVACLSEGGNIESQ